MSLHPLPEARGFTNITYKKVIDWSINNESGKFDILLTGFNNYVESSVLNCLFSDDLVENKRAIECVKERMIIKKEIEKKEVVITGVAGLMSVGLAGVLGGGAEMAEAIIPKITQFVGTTAFAPTLVGLAHVGIAAFAFYKTFQVINGVINEVNEKKQAKEINDIKPSFLSDIVHVKDYLRNELFKDILTIPQYDLEKLENQKYLDLILFTNEKLGVPSLRISNEIIAKHNLSDKEKIAMNSLEYKRVHEISNIKNPQIRTWFLLSKIEMKHEFFYKSVSNALMLMGNPQINSLEKPQINNLLPELKSQIDSLPENTKRIVNAYLSVTIKENGICSNVDMKNTLKAIMEYKNNDSLLASILTESLQTKILNYDKVETKNKELAYLNRVKNFIVGSPEEKLTRKNVDVRKYILEESDKYGYESTEKVVRKNPRFIEKLSITSVNVLYRIGGIREKLKESLSLGNTIVRP